VIIRRVDAGADELPEGWARWELEPIEPGGRRAADELMVARGKLAGAILTKRVMERPPGSRLRKRFLTSAVRGGFAMMNRREYDSMLGSIYAADVELAYEDLFLDASGKQHGIEEVEEYLVSVEDAYSAIVYRPAQIVDPGGSAFAASIDTTVTGRSSGIEMRVMQGIVYDLDRGRVRRQHIFREVPGAIEKLKQIVAERPALPA
jgi:hypothetical protein